MADFDAIYEDNQYDEEPSSPSIIASTPEPIIIRGTGNMTV